MKEQLQKFIELTTSPEVDIQFPKGFQDAIAKAKGWRKVHMKQIKKDDPYRKQLYFKNPDGMYYVDQKGYYVPPEQQEIAKNQFLKGTINDIVTDNYFDTNLNIEDVYKLKKGGRIKKYQMGNKTDNFQLQGLYEMPEENIYQVPQFNKDLPLDGDYNIRVAIAQQQGWVEVPLRYVDIDVNKKWLSKLQQDLQKYGPDAKYIINPKTKEIISDNTFASLKKKIAEQNTYGDLDESRTATEVQLEQNRREGLRHSAMIDNLGRVLMAGSLSTPIGWAALAGQVAGEQFGKGIQEVQQGHYPQAVAHGVIGGLSAFGGPAAKATYTAASKVAPQAVAKVMPALLGWGALTAATTVANDRNLENKDVIDADMLLRNNYSQEEIHKELARLGLNVINVGTGDKLQWQVTGKPKGKSQTNDRVKSLLWSEAALTGIQGLPYLLANLDKLPKVIKNIVLAIKNNPGKTAVGLHALNILGHLGYYFGEDQGWWGDSGGKQSKAERAFLLINYLNQKAEDNSDFQLHAVFPSTLTDDLRSGNIYTGQTVPDSVPLFENKTVVETDTTQSNEGNWATGND